ncbi:MAG TPA: hypothetical protein VEY67_07275, partial [Candidatus Dormibacteraeota bacterium]|nr:hypothetical protein [Candidatus Dormibacteraeota bacterium]
QQQASAPDKLYSVVLMTDGENNAGLSPDAFASQYQSRPAAVQAVHTYPILFGEGDQGSLQRLADLTGGRLFDATQSSLEAIFKQIRGYQ